MNQNVHVKFHSEALLEELEARQLFSGGIEGILADNSEPEPAIHLDVNTNAKQIDSADSITVSTSNSIRQELVFIDTDVDNYQELLNDILSQGDEERNIEVILLDNQSDGIEQISNTLKNLNGLDAVHLIAHGSDGSINIGNTTLDAETLNQNLLDVSGWSDAFSDQGDLLIYGCNLAATEEGQSLVESLSRITQADVAASDDLTGQAELGGDWDLEYKTGAVETTIALDASTQAEFEGVLNTYTVSTTADSGVGSLRQAIIDANANGGADNISFSIAGAGPHTIALSTALPIISETVTIDGTTEPDFSTTPMIVLDGTNTLISNGIVLGVGAHGSSIKGLVINNFDYSGILVYSNNNIITGNYIGTDAAGTAPGVGNGLNGIYLWGSSGNTIGGTSALERNIISSNNNGLVLYGLLSSNNIILGNYIGMDATGNTSLGNTLDGIRFEVGANNNTVGGNTSAHGNVITGNGQDGIRVTDEHSNNNIIQNNLIGVSADNNSAPGNNGDGVFIINGSDNTSVQDNLIAGNNERGIQIRGFSSGSVIQGNSIGTDTTGNLDWGNQNVGIEISLLGYSNLIGGVSANQGNIIAFNGKGGVNTSGIYLHLDSGNNNSLLGNSIYSNVGIGIALSNEDVSSNDTGDFDFGANSTQNHPVLSTAIGSDSEITITGTFNSTLNSFYRIEFFSSTTADSSGHGEAKTFIGYANIATDISGNATINSTLIQAVPNGSFITATATKTDVTYSIFSDTSEFSQNIISDTANDAPQFGVGSGITTTAIGSDDDAAYSVVGQSDGKIVVAGNSYNGTFNEIAVSRYNHDGSLDITFGGTGTVTTDVGTGYDVGRAVTIQADGKIVVAGTAHNANDDFAVVRYNIDGTLDTTFGGTGKVSTAIGPSHDYGQSVTMQSNGKILVAGYSYNGLNNDFALVRYNSDGSLDTSFSTDGKLTTPINLSADQAYSVTVQSNGKILVAGNSSNGLNTDFALVRYNSDGSLDASFSGDGKLTTDFNLNFDDSYSVAIQSDGKILVGGSSWVGLNQDFSIARYNTDGSLDLSFGGDGKVTTDIGSGVDYARSIAIQADGKILLSGSSYNGSNFDIAIVRYNTNGTLDTSFGNSSGMITTSVGSGDDYGEDIIVQTDGSILVAGYTDNGSNQDFVLTKYNSDGTLNTSFSLDYGLDGTLSYTEGGAAVILDTDVQVLDKELSAADDFSGSSLTLVRNGGANVDDIFSATGNLAALTQGGNLTLSGTILGTVTTNATGTLVLTFNSNATQALVNETLQSIAYRNTSDAPSASVQIDWIFNDGNTGTQGTGGTLEATGSTTVTIVQINDNPTAADNTVTTNEDILYTFTAADFNFNDVDGDTLASIKITALETVGVLQLSGVDVTLNQVIAKTDIDAGNLQFVSVANANGSGYDNFSFTVSDGAPSIILAGKPSSWTVNGGSFTETNQIIFDATNFGSGGIYSSSINVTQTNSTIDAAYLSQGQVFFGGSVLDSDWSGADLTALDTWVQNGGILISTDDSTLYDGIANSYGLTIGGDSSPTWHVDDATSPIMNGPFGLVGNNGAPFLGAGLSSYFDTASLVGGDQVIAVDSVTGEPTMVLRQHGSGQILFIADEGIFRTSMTGSGTISTANDKLSANIFAWAIDQMTPSYTMTIDVTSVNDAAVITTNQTFSIAENAANTDSVGSVLATDIDTGTLQNWTITAGNTDSIFAINAATGEITISDNSNLDFETTSSYILSLTVSDGSDISAVETVTINVSDVATTITSNQSFNVSEAAVNNTVVGSVSTAGDSPTSFSISSGNTGAAFAIDNNGNITIADSAAIDAETLTSYTLTIQSTDGTTPISETVSINVIDEDEFDVGAVTDTDVSADTVSENANIGTVVGITANASDADQSNNTISYTLSDNAGGLFTINTSTGIVTVANALDYESSASHNITVLATSDDTSTSSQAFTIVVSDVNESTVSAIADTDAAIDSVAEDASVGDTVGVTASASDPDGSDSVTYSLSDNAGGLFTIDSNTGVVTVNAALDAETAISHTIIVVATSTDTSTSTQSYTISVTDVDEFDVGVVTDTDVVVNTVAENAANGTVVGVTALATDADQTNNTLTYSLDDHAGGRFQINSSTGVVTVLDGSLLNAEAATSHSIQIKVTSSDGSFSTEVFSIAVSDVDEFDVGSISDSDGTANTIAENASIGDTVNITALASDPDLTSSNINYSLSNDAGGLFTINSSTGVVTVASALDYESETSHTITVVATSDDSSTSSQAFTIAVSDVNESTVGVIADMDGTVDSVAENASIGDTIGVTASASDPDGTDSVTYSLSNNAGGLFTIDSNTGVVTVNAALDAETAISHTITVVATSTDTSTSTQSYTISVTDVDEFDVGEVTDTDVAINTVAENAANGTVVGVTALASDADQSNNTLSYSLDNDAGTRFQINSSTGMVTVADGSLLDAETAISHSITIRATSSDGSFATELFSITVSDVDEFNVGVINDTDGTANMVAENASIGDTVNITALASDLDLTNSNISYSLSDNAGGLFTINASTGIVTVASALDYESSPSHNITVVATSDDTSTSSQMFTIAVSDVNESTIGAIADTNVAVDSIAENASVGDTVGVTASASDPDGSDSVTYSLSDNAGGLFTIDSNTGEVTVNAALDAETAISHTIIVVATSTDTSTSTQSYTISVTDVDEFDVGVVTDTDVAVNTVAENAANGTVVGVTALASDADQSNNTISYSLSDDAGGLFTINASTGIVTVANALDYDSSTSHNITVVATSDDTSISSQVFAIAVSDVNDSTVGAIADTNVAVDSVAENAGLGDTIGITASASDPDGSDSVTYSLSDNAGGLFTIDSNTGVVTVNAALDAETAISHTITVVATSTDTSTSTQSYTISVTDVDEFNIGAVTDTDVSANTVSENANVGAVVGITANASDADQSNNTISYSLSDDAGGLFMINTNTGVVTVANALDYESSTSHNITVVATSDDTSTSSQVFTIAVNDVSESSVSTISDSNAEANSVIEIANIGDEVGITTLAIDIDAADTVTYSLSNDAGGLFSIDGNTGIVTVNAALNAEITLSHTITVLATSTDSSTSSQSYTISVKDVSEFNISALTDKDTTANRVVENATTGAMVGISAFATDIDQSNNTITYSLIDSADGRFSIDSHSGVVTVADSSLLDIKTTTSHNITIQATSSDGSKNTKIFTINIIDIDDEFDIGVITDTDNSVNYITENANIGDTVGIIANAIDANIEDSIRYSLSDNAGGLFSINANTGVVTVANALDYETNASHNITILATSDDSSTSSQIFTIAVNDINESTISFISDSNKRVNSVAENASVGDAVGISALATDADSTDKVTYSLSGNIGGLFAIDSHTGIVTVNATLDAEVATSHTITILATSTDTSTSVQSYIITVTNINDSILIDSNDSANKVTENASNGTIIGITALASNTEQKNDIVSYSLLNDAGGRFSIDSNTGIVTVANGQLLNVNIATSHTITIQVSSSNGRIEIKDFSIKVNSAEESSKNNHTNIPIFNDNFTTDNRFEDKDLNNTKIITLNSDNIKNNDSSLEVSVKKLPLSDLSFSNNPVSSNDEVVVEHKKQSTDSMTLINTKSISYQRTASHLINMNNKENELNDELALFELTFNDNENIWKNIDLMRNQMEAEKDLLNKQDIEIEFVAGATISITAGFVSWILRGGALISSLLSSVSLFNKFDPLAVVFKGSKKETTSKKTNQKSMQDKIEAMFDKNSKK